MVAIMHGILTTLTLQVRVIRFSIVDGDYNGGSGAGSFYFSNTGGGAHFSYGFRAVLVTE